MTMRFAASLLGAFTVMACGSSDANTDGSPVMGNGGATGGVPAGPGNGGSPTTPGNGGSPTTPGNGGSPTTPGNGGAVGAGGSVVGVGGIPTVPGTGGIPTVPGSGGAGNPPACDDDALASAAKLCNPDGNPCNIHSGFPGDGYCIPPPPEGKGIQIHFGPKDYSDPAEIAKYVIKPGQEFNAYGIASIPTTGDHYYNYVQIRMRPGSHHLINQMVTGATATDGFTATAGCAGSPVGGFPGTQNLIRNMPPKGIQAPENVGLGSLLKGDTKLCVNHHAYNFNTDGDQLREIWINVWFVDEKDVTQKTSTVQVTAGPFQGIPAHTQKVLKATATINGTGRIIDLFGHRHAWTDRFAVWKNDQLVYDSWHWEESIAFDYNSITTNPPLNPDGKQDGAVSGVLPVKAGDKINIECDIDNKSDNTLTFRNELYGGEMCILFGSSVGTPVQGLGGL